MDEDKSNRIFEIARDSGVLRGLQVFHNYLNEKLTVPEQNLEAPELEELAPLDLDNPQVDSKTDEIVYEIRLPRIKMNNGTMQELQWDDPDLPPRFRKM